MSFTKQNSSARRIFRFMGWAGSLVVLIVLIGLPEQGAYQLLPCCHLFFLVCDLVLTRWEETMGSNVVVGRRKTRKFGPLTLRASFLTARSPCLPVGESSGSKMLCSVWSIQWTERYCQHIKHHTKSKDTIHAWDTTATLYQESDRLAASPYYLMSSFWELMKIGPMWSNKSIGSEPQSILWSTIR